MLISTDQSSGIDLKSLQINDDQYEKLIGIDLYMVVMQRVGWFPGRSIIGLWLVLICIDRRWALIDGVSLMFGYFENIQFWSVLTSHMNELSSFVLISLVLTCFPRKGPSREPFAMTVFLQKIPWWTVPANVVCASSKPEIRYFNSKCWKLVFRAFPFMGLFDWEGVLIEF